MSRETVFYYDFDLTLGIKKNNRDVLNQALVDLAVSQQQRNPDFKLRGLTSYYAFQALRGERGEAGAVDSGHSRSHIVTNFEKATGLHFDALITSSSPVFDGIFFGKHGRAVLGYEAKIAADNKVSSDHFKNSLVDTQTPQLKDLKKFELQDKMAGHIISYVIQMLDVSDAGVAQFKQRWYSGDQRYFIADLLGLFFDSNGVNREFPNGVSDCMPYLGIGVDDLERVESPITDMIIVATERAILNFYEGIPWPEHIDGELRKRYFVEGKGAMLLHTLRQHKEGSTVCIFDDKYQVLRMLDILRTMPEFGRITIKGIHVEARSPANQKSYYEQIIAQPGSFVCYNTEVDYVASHFKSDFKDHALANSPVKPEVLNDGGIQAHFFGASRHLTFKRHVGDPNTTLFDRVILSRHKTDWHCLLASIAGLHQRILLPIMYEGVEATLIYDHLSAAWYLTTHNRDIHELCQHLMGEAYAGVAAFKSQLGVDHTTSMEGLVAKLKQQYTQRNNEISAILDLTPFTWKDSFIAARRLVLDEKNPQQTPLKQLVIQVLTGFIVLRFIKSLLRLVIEMPIRAVELKLAYEFQRSGYDLTKSPKLNVLLLVISLPRLFLRAVISPKHSWDIADQINNKWQRRIAMAASMIATGIGWGLLTFIAFPAVLAAIPGALPALQPLLAPIAQGLNFVASTELFSLALIVGAAAYDYLVSPLITKGVVKAWQRLTKPRAEKVELPEVLEPYKTTDALQQGQNTTLLGRKPSNERLEQIDQLQQQPQQAASSPSQAGMFAAGDDNSPKVVDHGVINGQHVVEL